MKLDAGFIPALGTPLDSDGRVIAKSYQEQIERMIQAGCCAVLSMGSMGQQAFIRSEETPKIAKLAVEQVRGRVPVFVGTMDTAIHRAGERMAAMDGIGLDAFVFTTSYYAPCSRDQVINYYKGVCAQTKKPVFIYDLPGVTQTPISYGEVVELTKALPNLNGIKSGNLALHRQLHLHLGGEIPADFKTMYSGLDTFDIAFKWGIPNYLDGMITCTPHNFDVMDKSMKAGDYDTAARCLTNVVELRDFFIARDLWPAYSAAMNMLGFEGDFSPDYVSSISAAKVEEVRGEMKKIGEL